jgi:glutathione synthase/RimK-type ligase-like ATP-grasp enzyme
MVGKILILAYEEDPHADSVCKYFGEKGTEYLRINTDRIVKDHKITFDSRNGHFKICNKEREIIVDDMWTIWNRRVLDPNFEGEISSDLEEIIKTETKKTWQGLLYSHKGKVVNRPHNQFVASNKIDQLSYVLSNGNGVLIPATIITNDPNELFSFFKSYHKICYKPQQTPVIYRGDEALTIYTNIVTENDLENAELVKMNPCVFQEYVEKSYELRITALEDRTIAVAIHSQDSEDSKIDWRRYDLDNVKYEKVDLPEFVNDFSINLLRHYSLSFGQIDMIVTPSRDYVFLELNPNGQWLWLEEQSGYNLTRDVAENILK